MNDYAVILSARQSSERLPGKALVSYCPNGEPNLLQIIRRWQSSRRSPTIIVATTTDAEDGAIASLCNDNGIPCYRGSRENVLERMNGALMEFSPNAKHIARALCDNPLVDVDLADWRYDVLVDRGMDGLLYFQHDIDRMTYAATTDVFSRRAWDEIVKHSKPNIDPKEDELEHPGLYFWHNTSKFSGIHMPPPRREYLAPVRTELDTPEDLEMFRAVFSAWADPTYEGMDKGYYHNTGAILPTLWALYWISARPEISALNAHIATKTQSKPAYGRGSAFTCSDCRGRAGTVDAGNLVVRCTRCGKPLKFYSQKPVKPSMGRY